jgi:uncharacterized membrane protein
MSRQLRLSLLALSFVLCVTPKALTQDPSFITIHFPESTFTTARDINSAGEIVGRYGGADNHTHGYLRSKQGEFTSIDVPGANLTAALGINSQHEVVGACRFPGELMTSRHGFLLTRDGFTTFDFPGATFTFPQGINARGDIVGQYTIVGVTHGFLLSGGSFTTIDFPGATLTVAWRINPRGQILGGYTDANGKNHVFVLSNGDFATTDIPGAFETISLPPLPPELRFTTIDLPGDPPAFLETGGINPRGDIVGSYCDTEPCTVTSLDTHGFLLSRGEFTRIDVPGFYGPVASSINSRGNITGNFCQDSRCALPALGFLLSREARDQGEDEDGAAEGRLQQP